MARYVPRKGEDLFPIHATDSRPECAANTLPDSETDESIYARYRITRSVNSREAAGFKRSGISFDMPHVDPLSRSYHRRAVRPRKMNDGIVARETSVYYTRALLFREYRGCGMMRIILCVESLFFLE